MVSTFLDNCFNKSWECADLYHRLPGSTVYSDSNEASPQSSLEHKHSTHSARLGQKETKISPNVPTKAYSKRVGKQDF